VGISAFRGFQATASFLHRDQRHGTYRQPDTSLGVALGQASTASLK
jgi:hypothetical protein